MLNEKTYKMLKNIGDRPINIDCTVSDVSPEMWENIKQAFGESTFLRTNITSCAWILKNYKKIVGGYYRDFKKVAPDQEPYRYSAEYLNSLLTRYSDNDDDQ